MVDGALSDGAKQHKKWQLFCSKASSLTTGLSARQQRAVDAAAGPRHVAVRVLRAVHALRRVPRLRHQRRPPLESAVCVRATCATSALSPPTFASRIAARNFRRSGPVGFAQGQQCGRREGEQSGRHIRRPTSANVPCGQISHRVAWARAIVPGRQMMQSLISSSGAIDPGRQSTQSVNPPCACVPARQV